MSSTRAHWPSSAIVARGVLAAAAVAALCGKAAAQVPTATIDWVGLMSDESMRATAAAPGTLLTFEWSSGFHNVYKMASKEAFDACDFAGAEDLGSTSPVVVSHAGGDAYYACQVGSHCQSGQKVAVHELKAPPPPATTTTTTKAGEMPALVDVHIFSDAACTTEWATGIPADPHASVTSGACFQVGLDATQIMSVKVEVQPGDEVVHIGAGTTCGAAVTNPELNCKLDHSECCAISDESGLLFAYKTMLHDHSSHVHGDHSETTATPEPTPTPAPHDHDHDHDHDHGTTTAAATPTTTKAPEAPLSSGATSAAVLLTAAATTAAAAWACALLVTDVCAQTIV